MFALFTRPGKPRQPSRRRAAARPRLEPLEERLVPSVAAEEQLFVYQLNRARNDPLRYAQTDLNGVIDPKTGNPMTTELNKAAYPRRGPLAVNDQLFNSSGQKADALPGTPWGQGQPDPPNPHDGYESLIQANGYAGKVGESLAAGYTSASATLQQLVVDENPAMNNGHRIHLLGADIWADQREIGVGHRADPASTYGDYWAVHTGVRDAAHRFLTGVVYHDANGNRAYDLNEGLAGVTVSAGGASVKTNAAGGYAILVPEGTCTVTAQGAGFQGTASCGGVVVGFDNVEVDFLSGLNGGVVNFNFDQEVPVTLTISRFVQIDNPDDGRLGGQQGDYYAHLWIDGVMHETGTIDGDVALLNGPYTVTPGWSFTRFVPFSQKTVPVVIEVFDYDPVDRDDQMDVNPAAGKVALTLTYDLTTGTWAADVPPGTPAGEKEYQGNGDADRGRVSFDITQQETIGQRQQALHQPSGAIQAGKWNDLNANGVHERGQEPYLEGWKIYLDLNGNGALDPGEPWRSTMASAKGVTFANLLPGKTYTVAEVMKPGWRQTYPGGPGTHRVTVQPGQTAAVSFGNTRVGKIQGQVWEDGNGNGRKDEGALAGLYGWEVYLDLNTNGRCEAAEPRTRTNDNGFYAFEVLPGTYTVAEVPQPGWQRTFPQSRAGTHTVTVGPNKTVTGIDFGNRRLPVRLAAAPVSPNPVRLWVGVSEGLATADRLVVATAPQPSARPPAAPVPSDVAAVTVRKELTPDKTKEVSVPARDAVFAALGRGALVDLLLPAVRPLEASLWLTRL